MLYESEYINLCDCYANDKQYCLIVQIYFNYIFINLFVIIYSRTIKTIYILNS